MSSNLYEAVFNGSPDGGCLIAPTPDAVIIAINDVMLAMTGRKRESFIGRSVFDAFPGDPADPGESGQEALRRSIGLAVSTGLPQLMEAQRYPIQVTHPDGRVEYEERYWRAVNAPIFDAAGTITCIAHTARDMTAQFRSEAALRDSEARLRAFIMAASDVVYRMSPDWSHMHQLDGRGFLKTTAVMAAYRIEDYVHPGDRQLARDAINEAIRDKTVFALEHRVLRADGSHGWTYSKAVPMFDAAGAITEWIGTASDITERKLVEEKLRSTDRRKDEFLAMLAHELRNPLAPISAAAQLLQLGRLDQRQVLQTSEIIVRQVRHMTSLVDDLLDVSRVTRGLVKLDRAVLDIRQIVAEATEQAAPLIQTRGHHLALHLASDATLVLGDRKRLIQVVANLVNNAAKYTPEGGMITLRTEATLAEVLLHVADNGIGIEVDVIARMFDLFAQAAVTPARTSGGLGLGLALVKSIVELHGGTVQCTSQGAGTGSTFTVRLPRVAAPVEVPDAAEAPDAGPAAPRPLRLLVVDDNADAASMLALLLEAAGHTTFVEHSPAKALARARAEAPDVCLLDIGLPDMDGNALARQLRARPETAGATLIAVTGYGQDQDRQLSHAAGFDHHLVKPVDTTALLAILGRITKAGAG